MEEAKVRVEAWWRDVAAVVVEAQWRDVAAVMRVVAVAATDADVRLSVEQAEGGRMAGDMPGGHVAHGPSSVRLLWRVM